MQFAIQLIKISGVEIPINYQYPLSSAIYRILQKGDAGYSRPSRRGLLWRRSYRNGPSGRCEDHISQKVYKIFEKTNLTDRI